MKRFAVTLPAAIVAALSTSVSAQWPLHPANVPRGQDGKPNLNAPAPRAADGKPDLSGIWMIYNGPDAGDTNGRPPRVSGGNAGAGFKDGLPFQPWAADLQKKRDAEGGLNDPDALCLPQGLLQYHVDPQPLKIVQMPQQIVIIYESNYGLRTIYMDGRELPPLGGPQPYWHGYSVGRWDGDTLVVESTGFNGRNWLDVAGHPHSEELRLTERFRRTSFGRLEIEQTVNDPKAFEKPFTVRIEGYYLPDTDLLEYVCLENEKDRAHFTGTAAAMMPPKPVKVAPEILAKYVGTYDFRFPENPNTPQYFRVRLVDGQLVGDGLPPLVPISETRFFGGSTIYFVLDSSGRVTHMVVSAAEGDLRMPRVGD